MTRRNENWSCIFVARHNENWSCIEGSIIDYCRVDRYCSITMFDRFQKLIDYLPKRYSKFEQRVLGETPCIQKHPIETQYRCLIKGSNNPLLIEGKPRVSMEYSYVRLPNFNTCLCCSTPRVTRSNYQHTELNSQFPNKTRWENLIADRTSQKENYYRNWKIEERNVTAKSYRIEQGNVVTKVTKLERSMLLQK